MILNYFFLTTVFFLITNLLFKIFFFDITLALTVDFLVRVTFFGTGFFCFLLAIVGVVLTVQEFKNMELKEKLRDKSK
jgi:hypothetical protein